MWLPGAITFGGNCRNNSGFRHSTRGIALHVNDAPNDGSLWSWVNNPTSDMSCHFQVRTNGDVEQYADTDLWTWCESDGNPYWISVEMPTVPAVGMTDAQVRSLARIVRACSDHYGFPLQLAESPDGLGLGWHGMGGAAWGGHFGCPGEIRKSQRALALALARNDPNPITTPQPTPEDDPMAVLIKAPTYAWATDVGGFTPLADQATVNGAIAAGIKVWNVTDGDFQRMRRTDAPGTVFFNSHRGFAVSIGGEHAHGLTEQADVDGYRNAGYSLVPCTDAEFARVLGEVAA